MLSFFVWLTVTEQSSFILWSLPYMVLILLYSKVSVFSPNTVKYKSEKMMCLDTFLTVLKSPNPTFLHFFK